MLRISTNIGSRVATPSPSPSPNANAAQPLPAQPTLEMVPGEPGRYRIAAEPVTPSPSPRVSAPKKTSAAGPHVARRLTPAIEPAPTQARSHGRPRDVDALIMQLQHEYPHAHIRVTGRGRTPRRQAELMAQRRLANRLQFLHTYRPAQHIAEMDAWAIAHPRATLTEATEAFETIIQAALARGARVSNHLSDQARDISIPTGEGETRDAIRNRIHGLGGRCLDEHDAVGGPHWHVDFAGGSIMGPR